MNTLKFISKRYGLDLSSNKYKEDDFGPIKLKYSRFKELPKLFRKLGFKNGVEIGVSRGLYSKVLLQANKELYLFGVDPWVAYDDYVEYHDSAGLETTNSNLEVAKNRLAPFAQRFEYVRKFSMDAVKDYEDNSLDFVFIDGNHTFEYVINDIAEWSKKVRPGGIIAGHDYWTSSEKTKWDRITDKKDLLKLCQVEDAVNAWTKANKIKPWFVFIDDRCPTWFWVKE